MMMSKALATVLIFPKRSAYISSSVFRVRPSLSHVQFRYGHTGVEDLATAIIAERENQLQEQCLEQDEVLGASQDPFKEYLPDPEPEEIEPDYRSQPLYDVNSSSVAHLRESVRKLQGALDSNDLGARSARSSVLESLKDPVRYKSPPLEEAQYDPVAEKMYIGPPRPVFFKRLKELGLHGQTKFDSEMQYESAKRDYLRYRRRRVYQQLAEKGITHRRPRKVTAEQYRRFKEYLQTGRYPHGPEPGPSYVKQADGSLMRKDIFDRERCLDDCIDTHAALMNHPQLVEKDSVKFKLDGFEQMESISSDKLVEVIRAHPFDDFEQKRQWLISLMHNVQKSLQKVEAQKEFIFVRQQVLKDYRNETAPAEYDILARDPHLARIYSEPRGDWEEMWLRGFAIKVDRQHAELTRKRLAIKAEIDMKNHQYSDPQTARWAEGVRLDRDRDENHLAFLERNVVRDRYVVMAETLDNQHRHRANPDVFRRFGVQDWRRIEKERMLIVNANEWADRNEKETFGIRSPRNHIENKRRKRTLEEKVRDERIETITTDAHSTIENARVLWSRAILNCQDVSAISQRTDYMTNPYTVSRKKRVEAVLGSPLVAHLFLYPFPLGTDIDVNGHETQYMHKQLKTDEAMGTEVIRNYIGPDVLWGVKQKNHMVSPYLSWRRHAHYPPGSPVSDDVANPFVEEWPRSKEKDKFRLKAMKEPVVAQPDNFKIGGRPLQFVGIRITRPCRATKSGLVRTVKSLYVCGNNAGCIGFGFGRAEGVKEANVRAKQVAEANMIYVPRYRGRALFHDAQAKFNGTIIKFIAVPPGHGLVCPPILKAILESAGIKDCTAMIIGNRNNHSVIKAAFRALACLNDLDGTAWARGRRVIDMVGEVSGQTYHLPQDFHRQNLRDASAELRRWKRNFMQEDDASLNAFDQLIRSEAKNAKKAATNTSR
eukprot:271749_1